MKYDRRKQQILETALVLFAGRGYHSITIAHIIREIGIARGTFYRYFKDKHDLLNQLLETNFSYIKGVLPATPEESPLTAPELEATLTGIFQKLMSQPNSQAFMIMMTNEAGGADPFFAEKIRAFYDDLAEVFAGYITRVQEEGLAKGRDPRILAHLILGALREVFVQWARKDRFDNLETLIHETVSFIVYGTNE